MADINPTGNSATARNQASGAKRPDPLIGTVLSERYRILEVVGRGGMGVVYKARHEFMDRLVALKMLLPTLVADERSIERFQTEARAASRINHPNIIALHDFGLTEDKLPYLVMDYLEGCTLGDLIKRDGQLGVQRTITIFLQICDALDHAHRQKVVHRDLKPGNIMLVQHDEDPNFVKVVDFGVAKMYEAEGDEPQRLTQTGELFGSPVYMSPEQCQGDQLDARSDVYSLGCVLYETLTGKLPLVGKNAIETIARHMQVQPQSLADARPDLYIPDWLEAIVFKAMAKKPEHRFQSMLEFHDDLMLGFTSTCSSSQLQALPPRVIGASMSSMKLRAIEMPKGGQTSGRRNAAPKAGPNTTTRVLMLAIAGAALLGGAAIAFALLKPPEPQAFRPETQYRPDTPEKVITPASTTTTTTTADENSRVVPAKESTSPNKAATTKVVKKSVSTESVAVEPAAKPPHVPTHKVTKAVVQSKPHSTIDPVPTTTAAATTKTTTPATTAGTATAPHKKHHLDDPYGQWGDFTTKHEDGGKIHGLPTD